VNQVYLPSRKKKGLGGGEGEKTLSDCMLTLEQGGGGLLRASRVRTTRRRKGKVYSRPLDRVNSLYWGRTTQGLPPGNSSRKAQLYGKKRASERGRSSPLPECLRRKKGET